MARVIIYSVLALSLLLTVLAAPTLEGAEKKCVPGKAFFNGCNHCFCAGSQSGESFIVCTLKYCRNYERLLPPEDFYTTGPILTINNEVHEEDTDVSKDYVDVDVEEDYVDYTTPTPATIVEVVTLPPHRVQIFSK